jgi:hypothetical protein
MSKRANNKLTRGKPVELFIDGQSVSAYEGETIAAVLLLQEKTTCYRTAGDRPRMMYCNMGVCFECRVGVTQHDSSRWVLACVTAVKSQMRIDTKVNLSQWIAQDPSGASVEESSDV